MATPLEKTDAMRPRFDSAEMGAIAHLYRGEVYRSTIWRTRETFSPRSSERSVA